MQVGRAGLPVENVLRGLRVVCRRRTARDPQLLGVLVTGARNVQHQSSTTGERLDSEVAVLLELVDVLLLAPEVLAETRMLDRHARQDERDADLGALPRRQREHDGSSVDLARRPVMLRLQCRVHGV